MKTNPSIESLKADLYSKLLLSPNERVYLDSVMDVVYLQGKMEGFQEFYDELGKKETEA